MTSRTKRLEKARRVRRRTGLSLRALRDGRITLYGALEEPQTSSLRHAKIFDVLRAAPHISDAGAKKILLTARVWPLTKLGDLEKIEVDEILKCLPPRARG
jgi:hypothetical protein